MKGEGLTNCTREERDETEERKREKRGRLRSWLEMRGRAK